MTYMGVVIQNGRRHPLTLPPERVSVTDGMHKLLVPAIVAFAVCPPPAFAQQKLATSCQEGDQKACVTLARLPTAPPELRLAAIRKLTDQSVLAEVAKTCQVRDVRLAAIRGLIDQDALAGIARNAKGPIDRAAAIERLADQSLVAELARKDSSRWVRRKAAYCLTDGALVGKLVSEDRKELLPTVTFGGGIRRVTIDGAPVKETLLGVITVPPGRHAITADFAVKENVTWEDLSTTSAALEARLGGAYVLEAEVGIVTWDYLSPKTRRGRGTWKLAVKEEVSSGPDLLPQILRR